MTQRSWKATRAFGGINVRFDAGESEMDASVEIDGGGPSIAEGVHLDAEIPGEFGRVDAETLEVVASAIESLSEGGGMVGLMSHVSEVTARLPARIVVRKQEETSTASIAEES